MDRESQDGVWIVKPGEALSEIEAVQELWAKGNSGEFTSEAALTALVERTCELLDGMKPLVESLRGR